MREISLAGALDAIQSTKQSVRREGIEDLENVLKQKRNSLRQGLEDEDFHYVIETLLAAVIEERNTRTKSNSSARAVKPSAPRNLAASRLSAYTYAVRKTVEIGVTNLKYKTTVRALLNHIIDEIRTDTGEWQDELIENYSQILLAILGHRPHLEHVSEKTWLELVDLCCEALQYLSDTTTSAQEATTILSTRSFSRSGGVSRAGTPTNNPEAPVSSKGLPVERLLSNSQKRNDDLTACLEKLMCVHHIAILRKADRVIECITSILRASPAAFRPGTQQPCFAVINSILSEAITENTAMAVRVLSSCIDVIRRHWEFQKGAHGIKDQMLATLIRGQCLFPVLIQQGDETGYVNDLERLLDRFMTEYRGRTIKEMLLLHDLDLDPAEDPANRILSMTGVSLRGQEAAEACWAQLNIVSDLFIKLRLAKPDQSNGGAFATKAKRRKIENPLFSLVGVISTTKQEDAVASLQFLIFVLGTTEVSPDKLQHLVDKLFPLLSRDDGEVSNWSALALAMVGQQAMARKASTSQTTWPQILQVALTRISTHRVSRLSCYLAKVIIKNDLVSFADAIDGVEALLGSVEVSGPALLDEASVSFWKTVLGTFSIHRTASYDNVTKIVLRWLFSTWKPSRSGLANTRAVPVRYVADLLHILISGFPPTNGRSRRRVLHTISRVCLSCEKDSALTSYLISDGHPSVDPTPFLPSSQQDVPLLRLSSKGRRTALTNICDYLLTELEALLGAHAEASQYNQVTLACVRASLTVCIVAFGLYDAISATDVARSTQLLSRATELRDQTASIFNSSQLAQDRRSDMIQTLFSVLDDTPILPSGSYKIMSPMQLGVVRLARVYGREFWQESTVKAANFDESADDDFMDISQESHTTQLSQVQLGEDIAYDWLTAYTDQRAYQACIRADLCFASELPDPSNLSSDESDIVPPGFIDYLISLPPVDLFATRPFMDDLYRSKLYITSPEATRLLEFLAHSFEVYGLERCEAAMATCIDLLAHLVRQWTAHKVDDTLADYASQLYTYFLRATEKGLSTPHVSTAFARLLQRVIKHNSDYGRDVDLPSARTVVFRILSSGGARVKFDISQTISAVFGLFVLREHDNILNDIDSSIPHDPDSVSAMAVRLFLLSRLAASWSTLIRRCVYAIVEATGITAEIMPYARSCLRYLGSALEIDDQHDLFKLFVSQILYTWLESRTLSSLPYSIFDYASLEDLINDCKLEIAAQVVMRGKDTEIEMVTVATGTSFAEILKQAFGKCAAYCVARDSAIAPQEDPQAAQAAVRLRNHVGKETYKDLLSIKFPEIIATFFRIADREDQITKGFQKYQGTAAARLAYETIVSSGASQETPAVSQQPSFKSNYLIDELHYICDRTPYGLEDMWTPALYVYVFRSLLETIQPSLGPLHAAAVVRRIRILVSIAGTTATSGYCLEVTLGCLRPYLDNTHSSEDVIGLYRYLLTSGIDYLKDELPFFGGFVVSVLAALKTFMDRPQESTTQDSIFQSTLSKAQDFHGWIAHYALELQVKSERMEDFEDLRTMIKVSSSLRGQGTSHKDVPEGELLFLLLHDKATKQGLIDESSRYQIVRALSKQFNYTEDRQNDILADDDVAISLAPTIWEYFSPLKASRSFNLWSLRALGRAYGSTGFLHEAFRREIADRFQPRVQSSVSTENLSPSRIAVIQVLFGIVSNNSTSEAGLAERTIQSLLTRAAATEDDLQPLINAVPTQTLPAMTWENYYSPPLDAPAYQARNIQEALQPQGKASNQTWAQGLCIALIDHSAEEDYFLIDLKPALIIIVELGETILPYVLHMVLAQEAGKTEQTKKVISSQLRQLLHRNSPDMVPHTKQLINAIIYLRTQPLPFEKTKMDRSNWLDIDYRLLSEVSISCKMYKTALLFIEIAISAESMTRGSRRSSVARGSDMPTEALLAIFQNIDERDYYYGVRQPSSLGSMMEKLDFEGASFASLSFRGMAFDADARQHKAVNSSIDVFARNLNDMQLSGLSHAVASTVESSTFISSEVNFDAARKLEKWDIAVPETESGPAINLYQAFQNIQNASSLEHVLFITDTGLESAFPLKNNEFPDAIHLPIYWSSLAALVEMEHILSSSSPEQLEKSWLDLNTHRDWMESTNFDHIERLLSSRETLFSVIAKSPVLQQMSKSSPKHVRRLQVQTLLASSSIARVHGNLQKSLSAAMTIERLLPDCEELGLQIEAAARLEASNVLWDQGQMAPSIQVLRDISSSIDLRHQDIPVDKAAILAKLAGRISEARLEQPDRILSLYLEPAIKELHGSMIGNAPGQVFHEFASFCDQQLQDVDSLEDFNRVRKMRDNKFAEVRELDQMIAKSTSTKERDSYKNHRTKAKNWYELDNVEYKRLKSSRDALLTQSVDNYLLCLKACDSYERDAIRFSALWLQHHDDKAANDAVKRHLHEVSSSKFASLMNQWTSRLLDERNDFQSLLSGLVVRICGDHPYHAMYNIFATSKSKGGKDEIALSRHKAANTIVEKLKETKEYQSKWIVIHNACVNYQRFAIEKPPGGEKWKQGTKTQLRKTASGLKLETDVIALRVPPPTMQISLRKDANYKGVPVITKWSRDFSVASGISAPKILTAFSSDGQEHKMLFKAGNDDLRQDAIMEQVFEQVSELLQAHRETRQRKLGIRTYKVLPLTPTAGVIEFVSHTIPLHEYLVPAHQDHYPNDLKSSAARKIIQDAAVAGRSNDFRIKEFRRVCERFHPVLRFFFMERFESPDVWFEKRLAYSRTTAAISMLGHVLGLGDRHGHNILLDEETGEVVHIDLGIAFEQGRVLPVPEVVPFRLTRDIVDGMGVTRTEGVFRRCCEFTLDALRKESYGIMTILDVLRFDPLYSWSISPLRLRRLQEDRSQADEELSTEDGFAGQGRSERKQNEEGEADRALTVVNKKLSKSLSVEATVNQLIQQASDDKNLALLFAGWAAYI